ncbi:MAG TPA: hypothetical protein VD963_08760, partial [Phycisphaerales bacterium]|nr:hypothetical protein [Phycisphaerales bacterium]
MLGTAQGEKPMQQTRGGVAGLARAMAAALGVAAPGVAAPLGTGAAPEARGASAAPEPAALLVRVHPGPQRFLIDEPDAAESAAARANSDQLPGPGGALPAPTPGYVLTSRVIVRGADVPGLVAEAQRAGAGIEVFAPVTGYHVATLPSVRTAAGFAEALVAGGVAAEAYVDVRPPQPLRDLPTDPGFASQWHLHNLLVPAADVNAAGAWDLGLTGAGVTIGIVEDGWA